MIFKFTIKQVRTIVIAFVLFCIKSFSSAQSIDSSINKMYINKNNVLNVKYIKNTFSNGHSKLEGWIVYEKSTEFSEILMLINWKRYKIIGHKFGVWKRFYRTGQVKEIDSMGFNKSDVCKQYDFNKAGCLIKSVKIQPLVYVDYLNRSWAYTLDDFAFINLTFFDCLGIKHQECFQNNFYRSGTWNWYKKGKLVKTKTYQERKLIETKRNQRVTNLRPVVADLGESKSES